MKSISEKTSARVCKHMNKDHLESVHMYLRFYGKVSDFKNAEMIEITSKLMRIKYDNKVAIINFDKEISEEEIHMKLVSMIKMIEK